MKGGSSHKLRISRISLTLIALICLTLAVWLWEKTPLLTTFLPPSDQFDLSSSVHSSAAADLEYPHQKPSTFEVPSNTAVKEVPSDPVARKLPSDPSIKEAPSQLSTDDKFSATVKSDPVARKVPSDPSIKEAPSQLSTDEKISATVKSDPVARKVPSDPSIKEAPSQLSTDDKIPATVKSDRPLIIPRVGGTEQSLSEAKDDGRSSEMIASKKKECNYAKGKWVADSRRPLYSGFGCKQWLSQMWSCGMNKRMDLSFENYRWQPKNCEIPEFEGSKFLTRMRHKTIAFVGDSLGRQQFQSMMCMVTGGREYPWVEDIGIQYGLVIPRGAKRPDGWAYRFPRTNTTILYYWSASLCELEPIDRTDPATSFAMHLDRPSNFLQQYLHMFDVLVLNTGHHWNRGKITGNRWVMYVNGKPNTDKRLAAVGNAKNLTVHSVAKWVDSQLPQHPRLKAFFRTISPRHFVNGDWNTGGSCDNTTPLAGGSEVTKDGSDDPVIEDAVKGTRVKLLDITALSQLRDEGHVSHYSVRTQTGMSDCLHWCLPGVPDTWNEVLAAQV